MEINLFELINLLIRKLWIIIITAIVCASLAFSYSFFYLKPLYTSTTSLYVNNSDTSYDDRISASDLTAAESLVATYIEIIKSQSVTDLVYNDMDKKYTKKQLKNMLTASATDGTVIITVSIECESAEDAQSIAGLYVKNAKGRIEKIIQKSGVEIVDTANLPSSQSFPDNKMYLILGFLAGIVISCAAIIVVDVLDTRISSEQDFAETFPNIPVIGIIPKFDEV